MTESCLILAAGGRSDALVTFIIYSVLVMGLALISHRVMSKSNFMADYFLSNRGLGVWAFMLTFAATSASAGSFAGFPALVYAHGWVLALWIAGYMTVPLVSMGLLGKRINRMARQADAITLPELMLGRFESRTVSITATVLIVSLLSLYLIPQFKLASLILQELLADVPLWQQAVIAVGRFTRQTPLLSSAEPAYLLGLFLFSLMVIAYTSFGGFRAVVWTDVLQGIVMFFGVIVLLWLVLEQTGGLAAANQKLARLTTPHLVELELSSSASLTEEERYYPSDTWIKLEDNGRQRLFRTNATAFIPADNGVSEPIKAVEIRSDFEKNLRWDEIQQKGSRLLSSNIDVNVLSSKSYQTGDNQPGVYLTAPGPSENNEAGFLPLTIAFSFFIFWTFGGAGQPGNKVRLMAFDSTKTLKRGMAWLVIYFGVIYFALVVIFSCARLLVPAIDQTPDRIMPVLSMTVASNAGIPWLAGILIAAPFAAAMSTVDSFMLMISSSLVRDVYQREFNPDVSEKTAKRLSYLCTAGVGIFAMLAAVNSPKFLQVVIIFASSGLASVFLIPIALGLYWPRYNAPGAIASMLGGFFTCMFLYVGGYLSDYFAGATSLNDMGPLKPLHFDPLVWGIIGAAICGVLVTLRTPTPSRELIRKYF